MDEQYLLLRLPLADARMLREMMTHFPSRVKKNLKIQFDDAMRYAEITVLKKPLLAKLVELPTIIEVSKATNGVNIFKLGDIAQMLYVSETGRYDGLKGQQWPHGLTMPLKNVRRRRFRKMTRNPEEVRTTSDVQKEVEWLLRTDNEALSSRYEIIYEDVGKQAAPNDQGLCEITEESLFGVISDSE